MSCGCSKCALDRSKGGSGCMDHAEKPSHAHGAAVPTSSKFAQLRRKIAVKMELPGMKMPGLPTPSRMGMGSTSLTRAPAPAGGPETATSTKVAIAPRDMRPLGQAAAMRQFGMKLPDIQAHHAARGEALPARFGAGAQVPQATQRPMAQPQEFDFGSSAGPALELVRKVPGQR